MSEKNKAYRAWYFQHPDGTPQDAWDAAWANQQGRFASRKHEEQQARIEELEKEQAAWRIFTKEAEQTLAKADKKIVRLEELEAENKRMYAKLAAVEFRLGEYMSTNDPTAVSYAAQLRRIIQGAG